MQQHRERVPRVNEPRTAGPIPSSMDATTGFRIPECDIVNPRRLIRHQRALQAQVAQDFCRSWLDTIGTTGRRGHRPIAVDPERGDAEAVAARREGLQERAVGGRVAIAPGGGKREADDDDVVMHHFFSRALSESISPKYHSLGLKIL